MELRLFKQFPDGTYDISDLAIATYDIPYADRSNKNKLDLYLPKAAQPSYPLVVFVHSGGFFKSDKARHLSNILNCLLYGYAVSSVNFRLNDETPYFGSRTDFIDALNFLAAREEIDSERILLWGESYGSYLALDVVVNHPMKLTFKPRGVIDMACAVDLNDFHQHKKAAGQELIVRGVDNDILTFNAGGEYLTEAIKSTSFIEHFTGDEPPICILHGEEDEIVPVRYSLLLDQILTDKGIEHETHIIPGGFHGIDHYAAPEYNRLIIDFIRKQFHTKS